MRKIKLMAATSAVALLAAGSAYAADPVEREGMSLVVYGQVNYMAMYADGDIAAGDEEGFFVVNNVGSTTRFGLRASGAINDDLRLGATIEIGLEGAGSNDVTFDNQVNGAGPGTISELRQAHWWLRSAQFGAIRVGRTDHASNGTGEIDLSGTGVADLNFTGWAHGAGLIAGEAAGFDGNGRADVVRYDTPSLGGFTLSTSVGGDGDWDVAARYARAFGDFRIAAGVSYVDLSSTGDFDDVITASGGIRHASGLSLTLAYGERDDNNPGNDSDAYNIKVGYSASLNEYGPTHFAVAYGEADTDNASERETYGAFIVQDISHLGSNFYLGYRYHENNIGDDVNLFFAGARVAF